MIVFTIIGMIVCALVAAAVIFCAVWAAMSGRVKIGKFQPTTWLRHYRVFLPQESWHDNKTLKLCWTFWGAKRQRGTRIQNRWEGGIVVVRSGWSESANGYREPRRDWAY